MAQLIDSDRSLWLLSTAGLIELARGKYDLHLDPGTWSLAQNETEMRMFRVFDGTDLDDLVGSEMVGVLLGPEREHGFAFLTLEELTTS